MSKRRLLLADDSLTIQKVVNLTFADEGIEVTAVGDGDAAMQKFVEAVPDLVMVDVNMPGLDGYRLCEMIKQDEETQAIPVILLVGSFEPFDEEEARRVGADAFLTKPFQSIRQLVNKVFELLGVGTDEENSLAAFENSLAGNSADTLEMPPAEPDLSDVPVENLGDAGMDDEMIQTAQIGSLPADETYKYESQPIYESFAEDIDRNFSGQSSNAENLTDEFETEDWAKTQPLPEADREEMAGVASREKALPPLDFDEFDLLEFPQTVKNEGSSETVSSADSEIPNEATDLDEGMAHNNSQSAFEIPVVSTESEKLSPELIEAIADRVVEKLSDKFIKRVVSEVLSQTEGRK